MSPELTAAIALCRNLPSPPGIALRIIELAQNNDADIAAAADIIAADMALSARMLRIANSPLYATRRRIENLGQALTMLGLNATLSLALGFTLAEKLKPHDADAHLKRIWQRSVLSALAARLLGESQVLYRQEELLLAGLLQDIGVLTLCQIEREGYAELLAKAGDNQTLLQLEHATYGCTHADVGAYVASLWNLPEYLIDAVRKSESPDELTTQFQACVALSGPIADIWLDDDTDAARQRAMALVNQTLGIDSAHFDRLLAQMAKSLPDIGAMFDVTISSPLRLQHLIEHAKELAALRNLREMQQAALARKRADEFEARIKRLSDEARRDELTGLLNRRQLEAILKQEFDLASRHGWPLSVAFIDIDNFKTINDKHGHLIGDEVLRAFAEQLEAQFRGDDSVARFGGEEFVVLLPNTPEHWALQVMSRVLLRIASSPVIELEDGPLSITFSAGIATQGEHERFEDVQSLLKAADDMLYRAKQEGRNRVVARQLAASEKH